MSRISKIFKKKSMGILTEGYVTFQKYVDYPKKCYAHNFVMTINGEGYVVFCKNTRDNPLFYIGSLYKETFSQIWKNSKIKKDLEKNIKPANCTTFCKNMQINKAIEDLINNKVSLNDYKNLELEHKNFT